ncbi:hypothetical protein [Roseibacillus persicicus]|uniref:Uncharacterized protein n=1 Tax=Roseibacillus persicicus TaxID=454148 RepID=A0A918TSW7_9BACT|nr:hypothetical protein [Roseibacillus persicicus]GHC61067.1 hypothetical protein GCM10007100_30420 [Roseibacillus persicicus]
MSHSAFQTLLALSLVLKAQADLSLFTIPDTRNEENSAFASFDSLAGLSDTNATGSSPADASANLVQPILSQTTPLAFPGGIKYTDENDRRLYTFSAAANIQITATANVPFQTATLQVSEVLNSSFEEGDDAPQGLTGYSVLLNSSQPTEALVSFVTLDAGTLFERTLAITSFTWTLPGAATTVDLSLIGYADAHDSIDAFVLDLAPSPAPETLPSPELSLTESEIQISWPSTLTAQLQATQNLAEPDSWTEVSATVEEQGDHKFVTLPRTTSPTFFRLAH